MRITVPRAAKRTLAVVATVATVAALSACASGSKDASSDTIKFGVVTNVGSALSNYPDIQVGAKAAVKAINDAGGVDGKKLEMIFCNTRGDTNQAATCGRQMVQDKVVTIVGSASAFASATMPITEAAKIPEIANLPLGEQQAYTNEYSNPLGAGHVGNYLALAFAAKQQGDKSIVVATVDTPGGQDEAAIVEAAASKGLGLDVKKRIVIPTTGVVDYTPYVQQSEDSGADAVIIIHGPVVVSTMLKEADAIGAKIQLMTSGFTFGQSEAAAVPTLASKLLLSAPLPSVDDASNAAVAQYTKELDADGVPESLELRRLGGLNAWLGVHAAAETFKNIDGDITAASVVKALKTEKAIDLGGGMTFDPASLTTDPAKDKFDRIPKVPVYFYTFKDGKMVDAGIDPVNDALQYSR